MPSRHPFYYAGLYYLQEPSAMTPASRLPVAPGGESAGSVRSPRGRPRAWSQAKGEGLLVANDISASRARALLKNIEVFGIPNSFLINEVPSKIADQFEEFFDKILVDAPCSGEECSGRTRTWQRPGIRKSLQHAPESSRILCARR